MYHQGACLRSLDWVGILEIGIGNITMLALSCEIPPPPPSHRMPLTEGFKAEFVIPTTQRSRCSSYNGMFNISHHISWYQPAICLQPWLDRPVQLNSTKWLKYMDHQYGHHYFCNDDMAIPLL